MKTEDDVIAILIVLRRRGLVGNVMAHNDIRPDFKSDRDLEKEKCMNKYFFRRVPLSSF